MSNQTQAPVPAVPKTIHIWMFATAVISTILAIPHAIVAFMLDLPPAIVNLHIAITLGFWIGGIVFATRRPVELVATAPLSPESDAQTREPHQRRTPNEVDVLEAWLNLTDEGL